MKQFPPPKKNPKLREKKHLREVCYELVDVRFPRGGNHILHADLLQPTQNKFNKLSGWGERVLVLIVCIIYRGIHEKVLGDVASANLSHR